MDVLMIVLGAVLTAGYLKLCGEQRKAVRTMLLNSGIGIASLFAAAVISGLAGKGIAVNAATVLISAVLGVPGTIMTAATGLWF